MLVKIKNYLKLRKLRRDALSLLIINSAEIISVKAMWCGDQACEDTIKEKFAATSRCMPFEQEQISDTCVCCGKPAKKMVYWGRAY